MVTIIFKEFQLYVYTLTYLIGTCLFVISYVAMRIHILPQVWLYPFSVSTLVGASVVAKKVYRKYHVSLSHIINLDNLVKLDMLYFTVVLCMDWLHAFMILWIV